MKNKIIKICLASLAIICSSCGDFLEEYSQHMIIAKSVNDLDEVLLGDGYINSYSVSNGPNGARCAGFFNILADDVNTCGALGETSKAWGNCLSTIYGYFAWQLRVGSNFEASYFQDDNATWNDLYARINVANVILDEIIDLPHSNDKDHATYLRVQGEAHFLRAYCYFTLANLYGDAYAPTTCAAKPCVPLKLTPYIEHDKNKPTQFERASVLQVYEQIVKDLTIAEELLTESPQKSAHLLHRASVEAVDLLLSRVYLYMQKWALAEAKAEAVMRSPNFQLTLLGEWADGFTFLTPGNREVIFSQGPNFLATNEIFNGAPGDFCVSKELADLYSPEDKRLECFFGKHSSDSITLARKYERGSIVSHISDVFTLRMSEAYLNRAEACAMQSGKEQDAYTFLNQLRKQRIAGYEDEKYSGEELVRQIRDERRKELCFEGHRWFDLRRYAVCTPYPYTKKIIHVYSVCGNNGVEYTETFLLNEHDLAYTFAIPESVIKFDEIPMEDNPRESRSPIIENGTEKDK